MLEKTKLDQALAMVREVIEDQGPKVLAAKWSSRNTFKIQEAAEILGISRWSAYYAFKRGELPGIKLGKRILIPRHALEKMLSA